MSHAAPDPAAVELREALNAVIPISAHLRDSDAAKALLAYDLIFPELTHYRNGWFRKSRFQRDSADVWFDTLSGDAQRVERMINHLDVFEDFPRSNDDYEPSETRALANVLAFSWPLWGKLRYGVELACVIDSSGSGPDREAHTITFHSCPSSDQ